MDAIFTVGQYAMVAMLLNTGISQSRHSRRIVPITRSQIALAVGLRGDVAMDQATAAVFDHDKHVQQTKGRRHRHQEIAGNNPTGVQAQEGRSPQITPSDDVADAGEDTCARFAETPESRASAATDWRSVPPPTRDSYLPSDESVLATQGEWVAGRAGTSSSRIVSSLPGASESTSPDSQSQRVAPIEQARQESQVDPRGRIDPSRPHAAFDVERQLSTQEQVLGLDRLTRTKGEQQPPEQFRWRHIYSCCVHPRGGPYLDEWN